MSNIFLRFRQVIDSRPQKYHGARRKLWNSTAITSIKLLNKRMTSQVPIGLRRKQFAPLSSSSHCKRNSIHKPDRKNLVNRCKKLGGKWMKAASVKSFSKQLACPSSHLLLSFRRQILVREINFLIRHHLASCDFCYCEVPLLAFYTAPQKGEIRTPELPINMRLLAESILGRDRSDRLTGADTE
jgi:hypothetical protein